MKRKTGKLTPEEYKQRDEKRFLQFLQKMRKRYPPPSVEKDLPWQRLSLEISSNEVPPTPDDSLNIEFSDGQMADMYREFLSVMISINPIFDPKFFLLYLHFGIGLEPNRIQEIISMLEKVREEYQQNAQALTKKLRSQPPETSNN